MKINKKNSFLIYVFFFAIIFVLYYDAHDAKFINDTLYYLYGVETSGFKGILNSYGIIWLWQLPAFLYCILYKLFGLNWLGWHITFCALFSYNAYLLYCLLACYTKLVSEKIAFFMSLLFLISPFQTEVLAWGGCLHYIIIVTFLLLGFIVLVKYCYEQKLRDLVFFHLLYVCSLLCFEQAFLFPIIYFLFAVLILSNQFKIQYKTIIIIFIKKILLMNIFLIALYFLATKLFFGVWIAHYGSGKHMYLHIDKMYYSYMDYNFKFLFYFRYLPQEIRPYFLMNSINYFIIALHFLSAIAFITYYIIKEKILTQEFIIPFFFFVCYVVMLLPVLNLDKSFTFEIQSDRYGYVASVFFYPLLVYCVYRFSNAIIINIFLASQIILSIFFITQNVQLWRKAGDITMDLSKNYPLLANQKSYILNLPDNYSGAYMLRNGFTRALSLVHKKNYLESAVDIASVNIFSNENETSVDKINDSTYYVKCLRYGKWYYYKGFGATDYENQDYKVDFDEWNTAYTLTLKQKPKDSVFLLQCYGDKWKIIDTILPAKK